MDNVEAWMVDYSVIESLGELGIASFFLAEKKGHKFIIKSVRAPNVEDDKLAQRFFWNEIRLLMRIAGDNHSKFIRAVDFSSDQRNKLVFQFVPLHKTLARYQQRVSIPDCMLVGMQICEILEYLHDTSTMHGNVSPRSFLYINENVRAVRKVVCLDLFHAQVSPKYIQPDQWLTEYAATEQIEQIVDPRCDLYGLGFTLIALATGKEPSSVRVLNQNTFTLHQKFDVLLNELIQADPSKRPPDAKSVRLRLYDLYRDFHPDFDPIPQSIKDRLKPFENRLQDSALSRIGILTEFQAERLLSEFESLIPTDFVHKQDWLKLTSDEIRQLDGIRKAQHALGKSDYSAMLEVVREFANNGCSWAQNNLGVLLEVGLAHEQSYEEAFKWYSRAVDGGNVTAHENLALMYMEGRGITQDEGKAFEHLAKAAGMQNNFGDHNSFKIGTTYDWTWDPAFPIVGPKERKTRTSS